MKIYLLLFIVNASFNVSILICSAVRQIDLVLEYPCTVFQQICHLMESQVGGTSGAVYGIFFAAMAKAFEVIKYNNERAIDIIINLIK